MFSDYLKRDYSIPVQFLENAIKQSKLANSYILISRNQEDSYLFAVELAKILNCQKNSFSKPCNECLNCKWIEKNEHPHAFIKVTPDEKSKKGQVKVEEVRELINELGKSTDCYRVVFFPDSDMNTLPAECCNLMLKTVEESPAKLIFIFGNKSKNNILPTILSRSQLIYLNKPTNGSILPLNTDKTNIDLFSSSTSESLDKANLIKETLENNEIELKEFLTTIAIEKYEDLKYSNQKDYSRLYKELTKAQGKLKAFMQPKIVIEDLCLELTT